MLYQIHMHFLESHTQNLHWGI